MQEKNFFDYYLKKMNSVSVSVSGNGMETELKNNRFYIGISKFLFFSFLKIFFIPIKCDWIAKNKFFVKRNGIRKRFHIPFPFLGNGNGMETETEFKKNFFAYF